MSENPDGTHGPEHITDTGYELVEPQAEIDFEAAVAWARSVLASARHPMHAHLASPTITNAARALLATHEGESEERAWRERLQISEEREHARAERYREALRRMVEHTPLDTLSYEQVRELGRDALAPESPPAEAQDRCGNTIHSEYVTDHRCRRERGHSGDCLFGAESPPVEADDA